MEELHFCLSTLQQNYQRNTPLLRPSTKPKEHLEIFFQDNPWINTKKHTVSIPQALKWVYVSHICDTLGIDGIVAEMLQSACES